MKVVPLASQYGVANGAAFDNVSEALICVAQLPSSGLVSLVPGKRRRRKCTVQTVPPSRFKSGSCTSLQPPKPIGLVLVLAVSLGETMRNNGNRQTGIVFPSGAVAMSVHAGDAWKQACSVSVARPSSRPDQSRVLAILSTQSRSEFADPDQPRCHCRRLAQTCRGIGSMTGSERIGDHRQGMRRCKRSSNIESWSVPDWGQPMRLHLPLPSCLSPLPPCLIAVAWLLRLVNADDHLPTSGGRR